MLKRDKYDRFQGTLGDLPYNERHKLYKQAAHLRKQMQLRGRRVSIDDAIKIIIEGAPDVAPISKTESGMVVWSGPKTARVQTATAEHEVQLNGHRACVGDKVTFGLLLDGKTRSVSAIEERKTWLSRPDVGNAHIERVAAANMDVVAIVVSVKTPPLHPRLIDRYLIAIQAGGAEPLICVNKVDLLEPDELETELSKLLPYVAIGVQLIGCSAETSQGIPELRDHLKGKMCAFVGHSGVGKSSLINAIFPDLELKTGDLISRYGRGAHTTTTASLHEFEGGTKLIDTPGVRSFGLGKMSISELQGYFPEFDGLDCRFRNCSHIHEPGCAVVRAVDSGELHAERYDTYLRLCEEMQ